MLVLPLLAAAIPAVANFVSGLFTNSSNKEQTEATNKTNLQIAQDTNNANMLMNRENIEFQQAENEIARLREDNAVQRRASDLTAAGLSKTLAAGSPASANAMNAPNNQFAMQTGHQMQAHHAEVPRFDFDVAQAQQNIASAEAAGVNAAANETSAKAAAREAKTKESQQKFEMIKFAVEHGLDLKKFGLDVEKFEHQKTMDENYYELDKAIREGQLTLEQKKYELSVEELNLERDKLNNAIMNTVSEVEYREWTKTFEEAKLELSKHADDRAQGMYEYDLALIQAQVSKTLSEVRLTDAQIRYCKKNTDKIVAEMLHLYDEHNKMSAEVQNIMHKTITEIYNRAIAYAQGGKTTDTVVTSSVAHENALDRANESNIAGTTSMRQFFSIILMALFGIGKGGLKLP